MTPSPPFRPISNPPRSLFELAERFGLTEVDDGEPRTDVSLSGVTLSTDDVKEADLFVGLAGQKHHGARFAEAARASGAVAVLTDEAGVDVARSSGLPILVADDPRSVLGAVSAWMYGTDVHRPTMYGVTGTTGKTSTVYLIEAILRQMGVLVGLSSTAERHIGSEARVSALTTPEATELHGLLGRAVEEGCQAFAIEVSAQSLTKHRVDGVIFDVAGFTNLGNDHLDDYLDMHTYLAAKAEMVQPTHSRQAVVSLDTAWGTELLELSGVPTTTISSRPEVAADWQVDVAAVESTGTSFTVSSADGSVSSRIPIIGSQMAANAGLAIAMIIDAGHEISEVAAAIDGPAGIDVYIPGRTERVSGPNGPSVFVDFGHTPEAFESTLTAVRHVTEGKVIMVFGADGDRDASKRDAMAEAAVGGSDILIVTDHHPRFENPESIRLTLVAAARRIAPTQLILDVADPKLAIREAVQLASHGDAILWAGPGHQNYREVEGVRHPYSARQEAREALLESGW